MYQGKLKEIYSQVYCTRIHSVEQQLRTIEYHSIIGSQFKMLQISNKQKVEGLVCQMESHLLYAYNTRSLLSHAPRIWRACKICTRMLHVREENGR